MEREEEEEVWVEEKVKVVEEEGEKGSCQPQRITIMPRNTRVVIMQREKPHDGFISN